MDYILALTKRTTINGKAEGVGYEFRANDATKRNLVDNLKHARVVAEVQDGKVSTSLGTVAAESKDLASMDYNALRQFAGSLGLKSTGKADEIRGRIEAHQKGQDEGV